MPFQKGHPSGPCLLSTWPVGPGQATALHTDLRPQEVMAKCRKAGAFGEGRAASDGVPGKQGLPLLCPRLEGPRLSTEHQAPLSSGAAGWAEGRGGPPEPSAPRDLSSGHSAQAAPLQASQNS